MEFIRQNINGTVFFMPYYAKNWQPKEVADSHFGTKKNMVNTAHNLKMNYHFVINEFCGALDCPILKDFHTTSEERSKMYKAGKPFDYDKMVCALSQYVPLEEGGTCELKITETDLMYLQGAILSYFLLMAIIEKKEGLGITYQRLNRFLNLSSSYIKGDDLNTVYCW